MPTEDAAPLAAPEPTTRRILVVESHVFTRFALTTMLRYRGYAVEAADSVASAQAKVATTAYDLVFCDPGARGGSSLLDAIGKVPGAKSVVLLEPLTGLNAAVSRHPVIVECVFKPITVDALENALRKTFPGPRLKRQVQG